MAKGKLKAFSQLGYIEQDDKHQTQSRGKCPFCGRDNHFYINRETLAWDCKDAKCGKYGGFNSFLQQISNFACSNFKKDVAIDLSKDRNIKLSTLRKHKVGYLPAKKIYTIPIYGNDKSYVVNIRFYKLGKDLMSLSGCSTCLYGWENLTERKGVVWLCEGHWDAIALSEILDNNRDVILAVPSANTFKSDWMIALQDRRVNVLYDADSGGDKGALKVYNYLKSNTKELKFIHWPADLKNGYDIRDFNTDKNTINDLKKLLKETPRNVEVVEPIATDEDIFDGEGIDYEEVYKIYKKHLHLPNTDVLDILFGTVIGNLHLDGDPIWMFLVAPPGGTKSELIMSLSDAPKIFAISSLTPHSLISGYGRIDGADPSLIPKLNGKVVAIKDYTNILKLNETAQQEINGILRDAYDGECSKPFGNNQYKFYKSKFGIIAGVTPVIEQHIETQSALGARFLYYNIPIDMSIKGTRPYLKAAGKNVNKEGNIKEKLKEVAEKVLSYNFKTIPTVSDALQDKVLYLAQLVAIARGTVTRDKYSKEITHKPFSELGTRLIKQFLKLLMSMTMFKQKSHSTNEEYNVLKIVAKSSIPTSLNSVIENIYKLDPAKQFTTGEIATVINLPRVTCSRILENLYMLGVLKKINPVPGKYKWIFTDDTVELLSGSQIYE